MRATFDPETAPGSEPKPPAAGAAEPSAGFANLRRLRASAPAGGGNPQVVVVSETLGPGGAVVSTLRAEGPRLELDVLPEERGGRQLLTMPGPGKLILVDDSPADEADASGAADGPTVRLAGRGATFFRWVDALRLDGRTRDAELTGSVFMNHDARDGSPRVKLYGDRLLASFAAADAGGDDEAAATTTTAAAGAGEAELQRVRIDGNVVVEQEDRVITADHLQYLTDTEEVQLWSDGGRGMSITEGGRTLFADTATWNLRIDRVSTDGFGGGSEPIR